VYLPGVWYQGEDRIGLYKGNNRAMVSARGQRPRAALLSIEGQPKVPCRRMLIKKVRRFVFITTLIRRGMHPKEGLGTG